MVNQASALLTRTERARQATPLPADRESPYTIRRFHNGEAQEQAGDSDTNDQTQLELKIELGRMRMPLDDVQMFRHGSVVLLDGNAGEPVAITANDRMIGRGEVVVIDGKIGVRVTELTQ
jgi:flagellar motor switch protein FliN